MSQRKWRRREVGDALGAGDQLQPHGRGDPFWWHERPVAARVRERIAALDEAPARDVRVALVARDPVAQVASGEWSAASGFADSGQPASWRDVLKQVLVVAQAIEADESAHLFEEFLGNVTDDEVERVVSWWLAPPRLPEWAVRPIEQLDTDVEAYESLAARATYRLRSLLPSGSSWRSIVMECSSFVVAQPQKLAIGLAWLARRPGVGPLGHLACALIAERAKLDDAARGHAERGLRALKEPSASEEVGALVGSAATSGQALRRLATLADLWRHRPTVMDWLRRRGARVVGLSAPLLGDSDEAWTRWAKTVWQAYLEDGVRSELEAIRLRAK